MYNIIIRGATHDICIGPYRYIIRTRNLYNKRIRIFIVVTCSHIVRVLCVYSIRRDPHTSYLRYYRFIGEVYRPIHRVHRDHRRSRGMLNTWVRTRFSDTKMHRQIGGCNRSHCGGTGRRHGVY